ncbi:MAG: hypothetical protein K6C36_02400 [Clostridia bacterium]|nr:hypothetical protein [Clostridia bacterium]
MIALYIILGLIALIVAVLCVPIGAALDWSEELRAELRVAFLKLPLYPPAEKKPKKAKKKKQKKQEPPAEAAAQTVPEQADAAQTDSAADDTAAAEASAEDAAEAEESVAGTAAKKPKKENPILTFMKNNGINGVIDLFERITAVLGTFMRRVLRCFVIDELYVDIKVAKNDSARTAEEYGKLCAVCWPMFGCVVRNMRVRKYSFNIEPDFLARYGEEAFYVRLHFTPLILINAVVLMAFAFINKIVFKYIFTFKSKEKPQKKGEKANERTVSLGDPRDHD